MNRTISLCLSLVIAMAAMLAGPGTAQAQRGIVVGGSSVGGLYYVWAGGWAKVIQDATKLQATAEATGGAIANIQLVSQGDIDVGLTTMGALFAGMNGEGWAKGKKYDNVRILFPAYQSYMQYWTLRKTGMRNLRDLTGKVYSPGTAGGTAAVEGPKIFSLLGIAPARTVFVGYADANGQLADNLLNAVAASTGIPAPQISDLQASNDVVVLEIAPEDAKKVVEAMPYFSIAEIPANTYKGQDKAVSGLSLWNVFIVNASMSDDMARRLVEATFENHAKLLQVHASAKETVAASAPRINAPFHPGAAKYYADKGIKLAR